MKNIPNLKGQYHFLVTGGAGFIGSNLSLRLLELGQKVTVLDNFSTGSPSNLRDIKTFASSQEKIGANFRFIEGDIRKIQDCQQACQQVDFVLHQAALGSVPRSITDPATSNAVNVDGFLNMLLAARDQKVKRFVFASSSSVYGDDSRLPKVEGNEGRLLSPYAITKKVNELYAQNFYSLFGLETVGLRYFNVFGPRQDPNSLYAAVIPTFVKSLLKNISPTIFGNGSNSRDFTFVENIVEANLLACFSAKDSVGLVYNIASGGRTTLLELFNDLNLLLEKNLSAAFGPARNGDIKHSNADINLAQKLLNYTPNITFKQGLQQTIEWYKKDLLLK